MTWKLLHEKALECVSRLKVVESELISVLQEVDTQKTYLHFRLTSTFTYCTQVLKLSESHAYAFIRVARVSKEIPELKAEDKAITLSAAKRICAVITPENRQE